MDLPGSSDVLAQPTRARIFARLVERRSSVGTEELARSLGLHPNGVRRHLERLQQAGLVERRRVRGRTGRPGDRWLVAPDAHPGGERPSGYAELARWLARAIPPGPGRLRALERAGREIGRELAPQEPGEQEEPEETFREVLAALGFQPALEPDGEGGFECRLGNCPYRDSARESGDVVCTLHRGLTAGLLEKLAPRTQLAHFEPRDPDRAGCIIGVTGPPR